MIIEIAGIGCRGEVTREKGYSSWNPATEFASSRGDIDEVSGLH
jgi:hypothetical protein